MEEIKLNAEQRTIKGRKVQQLRHQGYVPAVVYGHFTEPLSLQMPERDLRQTLREAGANRLITLNIAGVDEPKRVLLRDWQRDALSHVLLHVDFYEVIMTEKITAEIPIVLLGESRAVKAGEGFLFQGLETIEIECLPGDLPPQIEVNLDPLTAVEMAILVRDLKVSDAVKVLTDAEEVVVKILAPEKEEVIEPVVAEAAPEVEVVGKKEKAEGEEEAAASPTKEAKPPTREAKEKA